MGQKESWPAAAGKIWPSRLLKTGVLKMKVVWLGLLGIALLAAGGVWDRPAADNGGRSRPQAVAQAPLAAPAARSYEEALEQKMAGLLSKIRGAGAVAVSITLENDGVQEHEKNRSRETRTVQEKDAGGGVRTTTEIKESDQVLLSKDNGQDRPVMVREIKPTIKGVLVVAEGAVNSRVKADLTRAVEAGLGVPGYKITVLPQGK